MIELDRLARHDCLRDELPRVLDYSSELSDGEIVRLACGRYWLVVDAMFCEYKRLRGRKLRRALSEEANLKPIVISDLTGWRAKVVWKVRYWRWPHILYSSGYHVWQRRGVIEGRSEFVCLRCGATVLVWPSHLRSPMLNKGDRVLEGR